MASPTPTAEQIEALVQAAHATAAVAATARGRFRRRSLPGDPQRREVLGEVHGLLTEVAEDIRRERIRAARDKQFDRLYGRRLLEASNVVKHERYSVYRMLNPGGRKWQS